MDEKRVSKRNAKEIKELMLKFDSVLGILEIKQEKIDKKIESLIKEREEARKNKDFKKADKIRDDLKAKGIELQDTKDGIVWKRG